MVKELNQLGVPVTVACRRLGISRYTYYYRSRDKSTDLKEAIMEIAYMYSSFGYRGRGFKVNHKKVYRLYREQNLQKSVKRRGYRKKVSYQQPPAAEHPNHVWSMDIIEDRTEDGKRIRIFNIIDVYSRCAFTSLVDSSITGEKAAIHFEELILRHGAPKVIIRD
jgi:putative transposase